MHVICTGKPPGVHRHRIISLFCAIERLPQLFRIETVGICADTLLCCGTQLPDALIHERRQDEVALMCVQLLLHKADICHAKDAPVCLDEIPFCKETSFLRRVQAEMRKYAVKSLGAHRIRTDVVLLHRDFIVALQIGRRTLGRGITPPLM